MAYNDDPMDQANPDWLQPADESEVMASMAQTPANPAFVATVFIASLGRLGDRDAREFLRNFTTPESRAAWGDFTEAAAFLDSIPNWGLASMGYRAVGDDAVHYIPLLSGITQGLVATEQQIIGAAAIITLTWHPRMGTWLVHSFGGDYTKPEHVPHY